MSDKAANNFLAPPSTTITVPNTPPTLQTSGSATGNPRNKCALKPGHSLMDWIHLGNSGADLSGTKGRVVAVTPEELAKHNTRGDAWIAIRGVVYNVSRYMDFHPGGVDELMRGVGRDATKLFNEVHAWVNYQQLLNKCRIGPLKNSVKLDSVIEETLTKTSSKNALQFAKPPVPPQDVTPRHDWIQNRNSVTIFFYTKQFCNPGTLVRKLQPLNHDNHIEIWIIIDLHLHKYEFEFYSQLKWPPQEVKIATESGKIEVIFDKPAESKELWPELGKHQVKKFLRNSMEDKLLLEFKVTHCEPYNHDSFKMFLKNETVVYSLPLGYHLSIEALLNSSMISKCYTPIPKKYSQMSLDNVGWQDDMQTLTFLIKKYNHRNSLSSYLGSIPVESLVKVSIPKGNFKLSSLAGHRCICFLAAGSGLTPFLSLIDHLLKRNTNRIELLKLFYFNKTSEDIWCREVLSDTAAQDNRFEFVNVLSKPDDSWTGVNGHVSMELLNAILDKLALTKVTYFGVCGPSGFNQKVEDILQELEFPKGNIFIF